MSKLLNTAVLLFVAITAIGVASSTFAADSGSSKSSKKVQALSQHTARKLKSAQDELADEKYADALSDLIELRDSLKKGESYAMALTEQMIAYVYIGQEKYNKAFPHLQKAVNLHALPDQIQHGLLLTMAQLYAAKSEYRKALDILKKWFKNEKNPPASAYVLAARCYYSLQKMRPARRYIKLAIAADDTPHQSWYALLVGVDYQLKHYSEAIGALKKMVVFWPDKAEYWHQLYGLYLLTNQNTKALSVMQVAYEKGLVDKEDDLLNLARLELGHGMPYYAAHIVSKGLKDKIIKSNLDNLQLLVTAWVQAQEIDNALTVLDKAAAMSDDGKLYLKRAQLCYGQANWKCAVKAAKQASRKDGLDEPGKPYIFSGMALVQTKHYKQAKASFEKAKKYDKSRKQARSWINYINNLVAITSS